LSGPTASAIYRMCPTLVIAHLSFVAELGPSTAKKTELAVARRITRTDKLNESKNEKRKTKKTDITRDSRAARQIQVQQGHHL